MRPDAIRGEDFARLMALAAMWSLSFIFMRALAPALGPVVTAMTRTLIAGFALVVYFRVIGLDADVRRHWRQYLAIGLGNSALPFLLFSFAAVHLPASYLAILNTATPLCAALLSAIWLGERLTAARIVGLVLGAAGVALVTGAGPVVPDAMFGIAVTAALAGAACYAIAGIYIRRRTTALKPAAIAGWSQLFAGLALLPVAPFAPPPGAITGGVVANVLGLALLCSSVAYLLFYRLIADVGPTRATSVTLIIPLFGMIWSAVFLGESITLPMLAGCALIIGGTGLVVRAAGAKAIVNVPTTSGR
jgi:drug/metabolite transporter (DMT)-like permease